VLLPFAVQFVHDIEHDHKHACLASDLHVDTHKNDCEVFHFKINHNSFDFSFEIVLTKNNTSDTKIITLEAQLASIQLTSNSSRAPPFLL
jgi:hypothetical protein